MENNNINILNNSLIEEEFLNTHPYVYVFKKTIKQMLNKELTFDIK